MKLHRLSILTLAAIALGLGQAEHAQAQLPVSQTEGLLAVTLPAGATTYLGLPFNRKPFGRYVVASGSGSVITLSAPSPALVAGAFAQPASPHSVQIIGGPNDGLVLRITANTATTITVATALPAAIAAGTAEALIVPDHTLGTLFGTSAADFGPSGPSLLGGTAAASADKVSVEDKGVVTSYFFNTTAGGWRKTDGSGGDMNNVRIASVRGVIVAKVAGNPTTILLNGTARSGAQKSIVPPAATTILSNPFAAGTTLNASGLKSAVVAIGAPTATSDKVSIENGGVVTDYFFKTGAGWRLVSAPAGADQGGVAIAAGKSVVISRGGVTSTPVTGTSFVFGTSKRNLTPPAATPSLTWKALEPFSVAP